MRVNPNPVPDILSAISQSQQQEQTALQQMSTGKRVNLPSDDPVAAALEVQNQTLSGSVDQYTANTTTVLDMVQTADSSLNSVVTQLTQAVTLGTEAANGTVNSSQLQTIAQQVQGIIQSVAMQANTAYHGLYLFAGTNTTSTPFATDGTDPSWVKDAGSGVNSVKMLGRERCGQCPGDEIFQNASGSVLGSLQQLVTALENGSTTDIGNAVNAVSTALNVVAKQAVYGGPRQLDFPNSRPAAA